MNFKIGERVYIPKLREFATVKEINPDNQTYKVELNGQYLDIFGNDLESPELAQTLETAKQHMAVNSYPPKFLPGQKVPIKLKRDDSFKVEEITGMKHNCWNSTWYYQFWLEWEEETEGTIWISEESINNWVKHLEEEYKEKVGLVERTEYTDEELDDIPF